MYILIAIEQPVREHPGINSTHEELLALATAYEVPYMGAYNSRELARLVQRVNFDGLKRPLTVPARNPAFRSLVEPITAAILGAWMVLPVAGYCRRLVPTDSRPYHRLRWLPPEAVQELNSLNCSVMYFGRHTQ